MYTVITIFTVLLHNNYCAGPYRNKQICVYIPILHNLHNITIVHTKLMQKITHIEINKFVFTYL